jgi:hypothetical protein
LAAVQAASSASFVPQSAFNIGGTQTGTPIGIADSGSTRPPFPRDGSTYLVLSTATRRIADQPDQAGTYPSVDDLGGQVRDRGAGALDVTVMQVIFPHPVGGASGGLIAGCLDFDFRFLSEEYPSRLGSAYDDAFVAELDGSSWTTPATLAPGITAPDAFTFGPNKPVTINSASMSPAEAAGTPYTVRRPRPCRDRSSCRCSRTCRSASCTSHCSTTATGWTTARCFIDNIRITAECDAGVVPQRRHVARLGPGYHGAEPVRHGRHPDADAAGHGERPGHRHGPPLQRRASGRRSRPDLRRNAQRDRRGRPRRHSRCRTGNTRRRQRNRTTGSAGFSPPLTFTVAAPRAAPPATGGSSSQQGPGDRDNDGIPDDQDTSDGSLPPVPGKTFDARVVSGNVFIKYPPAPARGRR